MSFEILFPFGLWVFERADPAPRLGSWSAPKSTLMNHDAREKLFLNVRMKESKGVLESSRADLDDRMSSF